MARAGEARVPDGATLYDASVASLAALPEDWGKKLRKSANYFSGCSHWGLSMAHAAIVRSTLESWNIEVPASFRSDAAFIRWGLDNGAAIDAVKTESLIALCADQIDPADFQTALQWGPATERRCITPAQASPCRTCKRLFFHDDARRIDCNHCRRKAERNKKRALRGTDLSERLCLSCAQPFTPKRSDAKCCSGACRAKYNRQLAKQEAAAP